MRLLCNETADELIIAWREFLNVCKMHKVIVRRVHTDNAKAHVGPKMTNFMRDETQAHYSTIVPNTPRQNSVMERQWRSMASDSRKSLHHGNIPRNYCWYALDESMIYSRYRIFVGCAEHEGDKCGFMPATPEADEGDDVASCPPPLRLTKETDPASTAVLLS